MYVILKTRGTLRTLTSSGSVGLSSVGMTHKDSVTKAELLQALKVVDGNMSFASANGDNERYRAMFPDSKIAQSYSQAETKVKYMIQFGIAPYIRSDLLIDLQGSPLCFKFDETTTSQIKKQYDGYVTCIIQRILSK